MMNEPFVGGVNSLVQSSLEANVHKRRVAYDLDLEDEAMEQKMTMDQQKEKMKKELCSKIEQDIIVQGQSITTEDVDTLVVKQDQEVEFGLKVKQRKNRKL
jgi:alpha-galactosidase